MSATDSGRPIKRMRTEDASGASQTHSTGALWNEMLVRMELAEGGNLPSGAAKRKRLDCEGGAVVAFECVPADKADDAIEHALRVPGVKSVIAGFEDGQVMILVDPGARFSKYSDCFDGPDWKLTKLKKKTSVAKTAMWENPMSSLDFHLSYQKYGMADLLEKVLRKIDPAGVDERTLRIVKWLVYTHGRNLNELGQSAVNAFVLFTFDTLKAIGFYGENNCNPRATMESMPHKTGKIYLTDYKDLFGKTVLDGGGRITNPLNYRPAGDLVLVVEINHITRALSQCTSPQAKALSDTMADFFNAVCAVVAEEAVAELGREGFDRALSDAKMDAKDARLETMELKLALADSERKADKADNRAIVSAVEADKKVAVAAAEADKKVAQADTLVAKEKNVNLLLKMTNKPIVTGFQPDEYLHPRVGSVGIFRTPDGAVKLRYTEQRDVNSRRTLKQSVNTLRGMALHGERMMAAAYGGINVIRTRTVMERVFTQAAAAGGDTTPECIIEKRFMPAISSSFAAGVIFATDTTEKRTCFVNEEILSSMPDAVYCRSLLI